MYWFAMTYPVLAALVGLRLGYAIFVEEPHDEDEELVLIGIVVTLLGAIPMTVAIIFIDGIPVTKYIGRLVTEKLAYYLRF